MLCEPADASCAAGVIFFNNIGTIGMCGHGTIGLIIAFAMAHLISAVGIPMPPPPGRTIGYSAEILLTWPIALVAFAIALATTLIASVYPAWKASRLAIVDALRHNR